MDPQQVLLPRPPPQPLLLTADLPPRTRPSRPHLLPLGSAASALAAQLYRMRKAVLRVITEILGDPHRLRKGWESWKTRGGQRRAWARPRVLVPGGFHGRDVRGLLHRAFASISCAQVVMAASVAAGILLFYAAARRRDGPVEEDRRLLPLEVRRNLRVMAMHLVPTRPQPLPRCPSLDGNLRAPPLPRWAQRQGGAGIRDTVPVAARVGVGLIVDAVSFTEPVGAQVHDAAEGHGFLLVAPIGAQVLHLALPVAERGRTRIGRRSDFKEIVSMLRHIKDKDGMKEIKQAISSVATEIQSMVQDTKIKFEKNRQNFLKAQTKTSTECEGSMKTEYTRFEATHDKFSKQQDQENCINSKETSLKRMMQLKQCIRGLTTAEYNEKYTLSELEKTVSEKIADAGVSVKNVHQGEKSNSMLRKSFPVSGT